MRTLMIILQLKSEVKTDESHCLLDSHGVQWLHRLTAARAHSTTCEQYPVPKMGYQSDKFAAQQFH